MAFHLQTRPHLRQTFFDFLKVSSRSHSRWKWLWQVCCTNGLQLAAYSRLSTTQYMYIYNIIICIYIPIHNSIPYRLGTCDTHTHIYIYIIYIYIHTDTRIYTYTHTVHYAHICMYIYTYTVYIISDAICTHTHTLYMCAQACRRTHIYI